MYVLVFPGGIEGLDWLWLGIGLAVDVPPTAAAPGATAVLGHVQPVRRGRRPVGRGVLAQTSSEDTARRISSRPITRAAPTSATSSPERDPGDDEHDHADADALDRLTVVAEGRLERFAGRATGAGGRNPVAAHGHGHRSGLAGGRARL